MHVEVSDQVLETILHNIDEGDRLKGLSNEELIREYLKLTEDDDQDLHVEAMFDRLWPGWIEAEL
jgi:hypothetical protein